MDARFIVRVLDDTYGLLGWAEVIGTARPQARGGGCPFWPAEPTQFTMLADGRAHYIAVHWADLDVARLKTIDSKPVTQGQVVTLSWDEPIWIVPGSREVPLPPVTVAGSVVISVPTGAIGVRAPLLDRPDGDSL